VVEIEPGPGRALRASSARATGVILSVFPTKEHEEKTVGPVTRSALSELLTSVRAGGGEDVVREASGAGTAGR
jgi:hypothetical protein